MSESSGTARFAFARNEKSSSDSEQSNKGECVRLLFEQWVWSYLLFPRKSQRRFVLQNF